MQSKEEIVQSTSAAHAKDTLAALLARQDLQPVARATNRVQVFSSESNGHKTAWFNDGGVSVVAVEEPRCMFDVPVTMKPLTESNFFTTEQLAAQP